MASQDPWQHRSIMMKCRTCMYRAQKGGPISRCRRHAPTMNGYPVIYTDTDWCGDHKLDENYFIAPISVPTPDGQGDCIVGANAKEGVQTAPSTLDRPKPTIKPRNKR